MATVNAEILRILKDKDAAIIDGQEAIRKLLEELQQQTLDRIGRGALTDWDAYHLRQMLDAIEVQIGNFESKAKTLEGGLLNDAWSTGQALVDAPLAVSGIYTGFSLSRSVLDTLKDFAFHKIEGLSSSAWDKIRGELMMGVLGGKTPQEVAAAIGTNLDDPGIFGSIARRAEVITKTEMGRVFSAAAEQRMEQAGEHVDGLEKMWRHVGHPKVPRETHLAADGQTVPVDEPFDIGGVEMMYPRDPAAPIDETINCG